MNKNAIYAKLSDARTKCENREIDEAIAVIDECLTLLGDTADLPEVSAPERTEDS